MVKQVLFVQGAGEGAYEEDEALVASLRRSLGADHEVRYPAMPNEGEAPYGEWRQVIDADLSSARGPIAVVGHSVGASIVAKYIGEAEAGRSLAGVVLIAAPFWGGDGWRYEGYEKLMLPEDPASRIPERVRMFLYHSRDDEIVPFGHVGLYARSFPRAVVRESERGGHQLGGDLSMVAADVKSLA